MRKVKRRFKSVQMKLFVTLSLVVILIVGLLIVMNIIVLEGFYMFSKINTVKKKEYHRINELYNTDDAAIFSKIKDDATANNFDIAIENEAYTLLLSTNENFTNILNKNTEILHKFRIFEGDRNQIIYTQNEYVIKKKIVTGGFNSILLAGTLDNGYKVYIQIPISAIEESVRISNNLLLIIGSIAILVAAIAASYVSKRFTRPIRELKSIANQMSKLDFSKKNMRQMVPETKLMNLEKA